MIDYKESLERQVGKERKNDHFISFIVVNVVGVPKSVKWCH